MSLSKNAILHHSVKLSLLILCLFVILWFGLFARVLDGLLGENLDEWEPWVMVSGQSALSLADALWRGESEGLVAMGLVAMGVVVRSGVDLL